MSKSEVNQNGVRYLYGKGIPHTYVKVELKGRKIPAIFDTGCEVSLYPYKFCKNAKLYPTDVKLFTANDSEIKMLGKTCLKFSVGRVPTSADLIVTDKVTEFLLGVDFMCANDCKWLVSNGRILIPGRSVPLVKCPHKASIRCIIMQDSIVVPTDFAMAVPVKMPLMHSKMSVSDWISEAKELRPGLLVARTFLPHSSNFSAVAMLNVSGKDQALRHDMQIGIATPCQTDYVSMATDADMAYVGARQCGIDTIDMTINTARRSDCQTVIKLDRLAAQDGPLRLKRDSRRNQVDRWQTQ